MNFPHRPVRLLLTETAKAGRPIDPSRGPASVLRNAETAGSTISRTGAAVGSANAAWRSKRTGFAARCALA
jgi:hypothetical protein